MSAIYQPWKKTGYYLEESATVIFDFGDGKVIVKIPGRHELKQAEEIYNTMREEFLRGYMQGVEDKVREIKEVLNCRY
jgi:hypothetical protein